MKTENAFYVMTVLCFLTACSPKVRELEWLADRQNRIYVNTVKGKVDAELMPVEHAVRAKINRNYTWYAKGMIHTTEGAYAGRLLHGKYVCYYPATKQLKEQGTYDHGLEQGLWLYWDVDGKLVQQQRFRKGIIYKKKSFSDFTKKIRKYLKLNKP